MALDQFKSSMIRLDKANHYAINNQFAKQGDANGRILYVQLTNDGLVESQPDVSLNLKWKNLSSGNEGHDNFTVSDATKGLFQFTYPTEMTNTPGRVVCDIEVLDGTAIVNTRSFIIEVEGAAASEAAAMSSNSFTALQDALLKVNNLEENYAPQLTEVNVKLAEKVPITEQIKGKPGQKFQVIAGTVRKADATGWTYVEDTLHAKTGLATVADNSYNLVLNYGFTASKVGTLIVTPDEDLAMRGVSCGSSVGTASANVRITMPMSLKTKGRATILEIDSILAAYVSIAQLIDQSGYTLTHTYAIANTVNDVPVTQVQSAVGTTEAEGLEVRTTHTQSSTVVRAYANFHGYIGYNVANANFPATTNNTKKPLVEWDATTNSVKVTPELMNNQYDINITGINTPYLPMVYAKTSTYFSVRFYDIATGALITTPDANMKFIYNSGNKVSNLMPADMIVNVRRGPLTLRPSLFTSAAGNLWIHGLMEI